MAGPLAFSDEYNKLLGTFHYIWSAIDMHIDFAIYRFLNVTPLQAHLITSGMMSGRKMRLLVDLIKHSHHENRDQLLAVLGKIGKANREIITHGWVRSDLSEITFLERKISGPFAATEHHFTLPEFEKHVSEIQGAGMSLRELLGVTSEDMNEFAKAALSASRNAQ